MAAIAKRIEHHTTEAPFSWRMLMSKIRITYLVKAAERWASRRVQEMEQGGPRPKQQDCHQQPDSHSSTVKGHSTDLKESLQRYLLEHSAAMNGQALPLGTAIQSMPAALTELISHYIGGLPASNGHISSTAVSPPSPKPPSKPPPEDTLTAYVLATATCGARWSELKVNQTPATPKECGLALGRLRVQSRFTVIADPVRPMLTQRRLLLFETCWRGSQQWEPSLRFPLLTNVAYGDVWQYAAILKGADRVLKPNSKAEYPIFWGGNWEDFTWALNFLAGGKVSCRSKKN